MTTTDLLAAVLVAALTGSTVPQLFAAIIRYFSTRDKRSAATREADLDNYERFFTIVAKRDDEILELRRRQGELEVENTKLKEGILELGDKNARLRLDFEDQKTRMCVEFEDYRTGATKQLEEERSLRIVAERSLDQERRQHNEEIFVLKDTIKDLQDRIKRLEENKISTQELEQAKETPDGNRTGTS